jgi:iron complex outermembrane receptor protein
MNTRKGGSLWCNGRRDGVMQANALVVAMRLAWAVGGVAWGGAALAQSSTPPADTSTNVPSKPQSKDDGQASEKNAKQLQQVTVTGSNIRSVDVADAQPVITISRADIERQGFATVGQILQNVSAAATPDLSMSAPGDLGPNQGGQFINLRGLGAPRTLVLLDGQRIGAAHGGYTNVNVIPTAIIDHIDVLANGASAVYGSDAIAGVINIITRKDFNGVELNTYNGMYAPHGDGEQSQYDVTFGKTTDRWGVVFSASYQNQEPVWASSRGFSSYPWTDQHPLYGRSYVGYQPVITNATLPDGSQHSIVLGPGGDGSNLNDYHQVVKPTYGPNGDVINPGDYTYNRDAGHQYMLHTADRTKNLYLDTHYKITDNITARFNAGYNLDSETATAGTATLYSGMGGHDNFPSVLSAQSYYNPYNQPGQTPQDVNFYRRIAGDTFNSYNKPKNTRYSAGLDGVFSLGEHTFNWDVNYYDSKITGVNTRTGYFNLPNAANALGPSFLGSDGVVRCGTPGNVIAGCVPLNPLGNVTQQMLDYLMINSVERYGSEEKAASADFGGDLFSLPGGQFTFATGVDHRSVSGYDEPDAFAAAGNSTDGAVGPNHGSYSLNEAYVEVNAPFLKDLPGAKSLALDAALRYSDYSNFGSTTNASFKLTWQPFDDLLVRASYGTGFRAPTVNDLYQGLYNAGGFTDPCDAVFGPAMFGYSPTVAQRCKTGFAGVAGVAGVPANFRQLDNTGQPVIAADSVGVTESFNGGNSHLQPETSYNGQVGFVYSPSWLQGFNASVDYWRYNIRNLITGITNDQVLANCYQYGIESACSQFQRQAGTGQIINLMNLETNAGWEKTSGYDFNLAYALPEYAIGRFKLNLSGTYVTSYNMLPTVGSAVVYGTGIASSQTAMSVWRLRGNFSVDWAWRDFGATWTMRYFSPLKAPCAFPPPNTRSAFPCTLPNYYAPGVGSEPMTQIASVTFDDVQVYWKAPWKATISLGANNVFNRKGPYIYGAYAGSDTPYNYNASYDIGRYVYLRYQQKF